jgi:hypothetical protein
MRATLDLRLLPAITDQTLKRPILLLLLGRFSSTKILSSTVGEYIFR